MSTAEDRADFFITYSVRSGSVWGLKQDEGWRILKAPDGRQAFPVWPKSEDAQAAAAPGEKAEAIPLPEWMDRWLPGMDGDGTRVAIHPLGHDDGVIMAAGELLEELVDEIEEMGG